MGFWEGLSAVVFDMDGVIFIGSRLRAGVIELFERLNRAGVGFHILTNTGASPAAEIAAKLAGMGLTMDPERITTSSTLTAAYVAQHTGARRVFTLGGGMGLAGALEMQDIEPMPLEKLSLDQIAKITSGPERSALPLVIGWTSGYNHELATRVLRLETCISDVFTASEDRSYAWQGGLLPGVLWVSSSAGALLRKRPFNPAKPNPFALQHVLTLLEQPASRVAVIGDSASDIEAGNEAGCRTVLVLGGTISREQAANLTGTYRPAQVIEELTDLL